MACCAWMSVGLLGARCSTTSEALAANGPRRPIAPAGRGGANTLHFPLCARQVRWSRCPRSLPEVLPLSGMASGGHELVPGPARRGRGRSAGAPHVGAKAIAGVAAALRSGTARTSHCGPRRLQPPGVRWDLGWGGVRGQRRHRVLVRWSWLGRASGRERGAVRCVLWAVRTGPRRS